MTSDQTIVVIGAGQAGGWTAKTLRDEGFGGRVIIVGDENFPPHERPPLSKEVLLGDADKNARQSVVQRRLVQASAVEGLVAVLHQQTLLRVHGSSLRWRDAEAGVVEELSFPQEAAVAHALADDLTKSVGICK